MFGNKKLKDGKKLSEYGIKNQNTVDLFNILEITMDI